MRVSWTGPHHTIQYKYVETMQCTVYFSFIGNIILLSADENPILIDDDTIDSLISSCDLLISGQIKYDIPIYNVYL